MGFIGGDLRRDFIRRIKSEDAGRLLAVPIDVGKHTGAAMVCDFWGEIMAPPFDFSLNERGISGSRCRAGTRRGRALRELGSRGP